MGFYIINWMFCHCLLKAYSFLPMIKLHTCSNSSIYCDIILSDYSIRFSVTIKICYVSVCFVNELQSKSKCQCQLSSSKNAPILLQYASDDTFKFNTSHRISPRIQHNTLVHFYHKKPKTTCLLLFLLTVSQCNVIRFHEAMFILKMCIIILTYAWSSESHLHKRIG